jgi:predicted ATPase/DNA-binding XRE family transcriptional regulator
MTTSETSLGRLLRGHRTAAGLTQEDLAEKAGVSARTISDVERGLRSTIYRDTAERLAAALGLREEQRSDFEQAARGRTTRTVPDAVPGSPIPSSPTRLIGRERELDIVLDALRDPTIRLLTLTGPGGIGKTRIAIEAANRAHGAFRDGVFFVSLGSVEDPSLVFSILAHALGVVSVQEPPFDAIARHLQDKQVLLVLDTFEHLLPAASGIGELLGACHTASVLVTSRETLHLRGEHEIAVPTLEVPNHHGIDISGAPASELFLERARAVKPDLRVDENAVAAIVEICSRVNGLPLAIELAAARVKHLPLSDLRDQLEHRLQLLIGGSRDLPRRQQTMRDTVAWSYELLDPHEQQLFAGAGVFAGGFTLEALTAVATGKGDIVSGISGLIDKSLVVLHEDPEPRYRMLDVIHEFAREALEQGEAVDEIKRRHATYYRELVERAEPELGRASQERWTHVLENEHDNVRAAMRWAIAQGESDLAPRLAGAVWQFWRSRGDLSEGREWLRQALAVEPGGDAGIRAKAMWGAAWLAYHQGDYDDAAHLGEEQLPVARAAGDAASIRNALTIQGMVAMARARYADAVVRFQEGLNLLRDLEPTWLLATSLLNLGTAYLHTNDRAGARGSLEEAVRQYQKLGDEHFTARATVQLAFVALADGDKQRARSLFEAGLRMFWDLQDHWGTTEALEGMATFSAAEDKAERAAKIAGAAEAARENLTVRPLPFDRVVTERFIERARSVVDDESWHRAWQEGRQMSLPQAFEYALESKGGG